MEETLAKLVFDSWSASLPKTRSRSTMERHLIYEGSGILIDLVLKMATAGVRLEIQGQVIPQDETHEFVCEIPVLLENGTQHAQTRTNALGEFSLSTSAVEDRLDLAIVFGERRLVVRGLDSVQPKDWQVLLPAVVGQEQ